MVAGKFLTYIVCMPKTWRAHKDTIELIAVDVGKGRMPLHRTQKFVLCPQAQHKVCIFGVEEFVKSLDNSFNNCERNQTNVTVHRWTLPRG